jgi:hypothetical protein
MKGLKWFEMARSSILLSKLTFSTSDIMVYGDWNTSTLALRLCVVDRLSARSRIYLCICIDAYSSTLAETVSPVSVHEVCGKS